MTLSISNLHVSVGDKPILKELTREVRVSEEHAIMGLGRGIIQKSAQVSFSRTF